jgi:thiamine-monophosphate kinase
LPDEERKLIEGIRRMAHQPSSTAVLRGIGDDSAILKLAQRHHLLLTTDLCIENVHFRREWHPPASVAYRCLTRGLSDIAAMGGEPLACFLSLGLPRRLPQRWVDEFLRSFEQLAHRFRVPLAGGDISAAKAIVADIVVAGQAPSGKAVLRSGARPGDRIYVTGELGGAAAVLEQLHLGRHVRAERANRHFYPHPRLEAGRFLRRRRLATAMIDLSDGLSVDLAHICAESHVTATIRARAIPVARSATLEMALHGGDDYELLFTAPRKVRVPNKIAGLKVSEIGNISSKEDCPAAIEILDENGRSRTLRSRGWQHFAKKK